MSKSLTQIPKNLAFHLRFPCLKTSKNWSEKFDLPPKHRLPSLGQFEGQNEFVDWRAGWNEAGLYFTVIVTGKQQSLWCRETAMLESDGVQLWIDTRDTHNVHRATRFCHWFLAMPTGGGETNKDPLFTMLKINRAREDSGTIGSRAMKVIASKKKNGYKMSLFLPSSVLNGWNLEDHRQFGFSIAVVDREMGWQTIAAGPELPISEDPSLWHSLELVD